MAITKTQKTLEKQGWAIKFNMSATGSNKVIATKGQKTVNGSSVTDVYKKIKAKYSGSLGTTKTKAKTAPRKRKTAKKKVTKKPVLTAEHKKHIAAFAGKLINEGLTASTYTKTKARKVAVDVVTPVYARMLITHFSPLIKKEMASIRKTKKATGVGSTTKRKTVKKKATGTAKSKGVGAITKAERTLNEIYSDMSNEEVFDSLVYLTSKNRSKRTTEATLRKAIKSGKAGSLLKRLDPIAFHNTDTNNLGSIPKKRKTTKKRVTKKRVGNPKHKVSKAV